MAEVCTWCDGVGITPAQLIPGTRVVVAASRAAAAVNRQPCVITLATVLGPADPPGMHWLEVDGPPGGSPMNQMYNEKEILGVPALGLRIA